MLNLEYIPKDKFPKLKREIKNDMYNYYYFNKYPVFLEPNHGF